MITKHHTSIHTDMHSIQEDFDFHHSFLITSALFIASVLAILYLSRLLASAQLVDRERVASNSGEVC
jgi:hypothetical protein